MAQIAMPFVQWFKKEAVRPEIFHLSGTTAATSGQSEGAAPEGLENIANKLSVGEDEELWVLLQFYRNESHANEVYPKMMLDESIGRLIKEMDGLVSKGSNLVMGGFTRLAL